MSMRSVGMSRSGNEALEPAIFLVGQIQAIVASLWLRRLG
jgi:hypothetical protein